MEPTEFADLHMHTTFSDGTLTPSELVAFARASGISTISITDHDTVGGYFAARESVPRGMTLIPGVEFSCIYRGKTPFLLHVLGYGIDPASPYINEVIEEGRRTRGRKHSLRLEYMSRVYGIRFTDEEMSYFASRTTIGKPHLAEILVKRGLAPSIKEAIDKYMKAPDFPDGNIDAAMAIEGIKRAGGIPVYAHPLGGECDRRLDCTEALERIEQIKALGIQGLECYYSRYSDADEKFLLSLTEKLSLCVSGGSDFHGKNKTVELGALSEGGIRVERKKLTVLSNML